MNDFIATKLIAELLENPLKFYNQGRAYQLLQEYFEGFSVETLHPLCCHSDRFVRRSAIWLVSELGDQGRVLIDDAIALLNDTDQYIQYHALEVVALCSVKDDVHKHANVILFLECENEDLCKLAMSLVANAGKAQLREDVKYFSKKENYNKCHYEGLIALLDSEIITQAQVESMLQNKDSLVRKYGRIIRAKKRALSTGRLKYAVVR